MLRAGSRGPAQAASCGVLATLATEATDQMTSLGLAEKLREAFSEFIEVRMIREGVGELRALCLLAPGAMRVSVDRIGSWAQTGAPVGVKVKIEQVEKLPADLDDDLALLSRTSVPLSVVLNASGVNVAKLLRNLFPAEVVDLVVSAGKLVLQVRNEVPSTRDQILLDSVRVLLVCEPASLRIERQTTPNDAGTGEAASTYARLEKDRALLHDGLLNMLRAGELGLPELPSGASTYACVHDGVEGLLQRLALFERVYVYMPFTSEDFESWAGASRQQFLDVLPTGRVIPVFGQGLERYEPGLMSVVLDANPPRVVHQGELALRMVRSVRDDHPLISLLNADVVKESLADLAASTDDNSRLFLAYLKALKEVAVDLPGLLFEVTRSPPDFMRSQNGLTRSGCRSVSLLAHWKSVVRSSIALSRKGSTVSR